mgnify:CR=1 FL=1
MAAVKESVTSQRGSGGTRSVSTVVSSSDEVLIAVMTFQDSNTNNLGADPPERDGQTFTEIGSGFGGQGGSGQPVFIQMFYLLNPNTGTANTEADTHPFINESTLTVYVVSGLDEADLINGTPDGDTGSGSPPAMSITTDEDGCIIIGGIVAEAAITGRGSGQASDAALTSQSFENTNVSSEIVGAAGAHDHSYSLASGQPYAQMCCAFKPAAGGGNSAPTIAPNTADATDFATDTTPTLEFTGSDTDDDDLTYEIQIDNNSDFSSPILSKASDTDAGFANTVSGGDTDPFNAGEKVSFTVQGGDALAAGLYYWRARCADPAGSNTFSDWTTGRSFNVRALPTVTTQAATSVDETSATLNGNITNLGNDTTTRRGFVIGTTTQSAPGNTAAESAGYDDVIDESGSFSTGAFSLGATGLTDTTQYFVRAFVQTGTGYAYGDEINFTTDSPPPPSTIFDTSVALESGGNNVTFEDAMEVAANSNRILVASISCQDSNHANLPVIELKWGTQNFTKIRHDGPVEGNTRSELWYLLNPEAGTKDLFIANNGAVWRGVVLSSWYNLKQQAPNANAGDTGDSTSPSVDITVAENDSVIIDALSSEAARTALGTDQVTLGTEQGQSFENVAASKKEDQDTGANSMSATIGSGESWAMSVAAFTVESNDGTAELRGINIPLVAGHQYNLTMMMRSTRAQDINVKIQDSNLANQSESITKPIPANTWTPFNFKFTAAATDPESVIRITLNMESIQTFYIDKVRMIDLTIEQKQYRIMRIQGSMLPGSFVQTLTLREKTDAETA